MSGLFGVLNTDGKPAQVEELQAMLAAMAYWGPDGQGISVQGAVGFGHLKLLATPEAKTERLPLVEAGSGILFSASARLDDRDELCDALGIPHPERNLTPDTSLLLTAWHKWGEAALPRLRGDWSFALWDARQQRLVLARDPFGQTSLYYSCTPGRFSFASCQKALLALPYVSRKLDDLRLAQVLTSWPGEGTATAYAGIRRLPPAHFLVWEKRESRVRQYWQLEDAPAVRLGSDDAYVEAFLESYSRAVRTRLRSVRPVGSTLSGGLDSSSVTALAARDLGSIHLPAFTSVPLVPPAGLDPRVMGDEWPMAHLLAERWPTLDHQPIRAEHMSPLEGIERQLWVHDEPGHAASNQFWLLALLSAAQAQGLGVLLTGQKGNGGVSWAGSAYRAAAYLQAGEWGRAVTELGAWKREHRLPWFRTLKSQLLRPLVGPRLDPRRLRDPASPPWNTYSAIHPDFAKGLGLATLMREAGHDPSFLPRQHPLEERSKILQSGRSIVGALWCEAGAAHGLEIRDPTADTRLLEFCFGCPDDQFSRGGKDRWLLRRAMQGLLPPEIQNNRAKGLQAYDLDYRLRTQLQTCRDWLQCMKNSTECARRLDLPRMELVLESLSPDRVESGPKSKYASILCRGFGVGHFLLR